MIEFLRDWYTSLGPKYGVDPVVFAAIYIGAIPVFVGSSAWLARAIVKKRGVVLPLTSTALSFVSAYIYLLFAGKNVPVWVYLVIAVVVVVGAASALRSIRRRVARDGAEYDLVVIGGGAAGLTASGMAASLGLKTLMVEKHRLGGDCTWTGCVPSKALLKAAKVAHQTRGASRYGLVDQEPQVDFPALMRHVRGLRQEVYEDADSPSIFEEMGVEVRAASARFIDARTVVLRNADGSEQRVTSRYFVIASGGRPAVPDIPGLDGVPYLTSNSLFEISQQPKHLAILGAGPIGSELAQAFRRLGSDVTVIDRGRRILGKDDPELTAMLQSLLEAEGIRYEQDAEVIRVSRDGELTRIELSSSRTLQADALLLAVGRRPNVEDLGLAEAGVEHGERGIAVDDTGRTNVPHIYAIGDVAGRYQFTHMSEHMAKVAVTNLALGVPSKIDKKHVPWATFTEPELAHVGASETELKERGVKYDARAFGGPCGAR